MATALCVCGVYVAPVSHFIERDGEFWCSNCLEPSFVWLGEGENRYWLTGRVVRKNEVP